MPIKEDDGVSCQLCGKKPAKAVQIIVVMDMGVAMPGGVRACPEHAKDMLERVQNAYQRFLQEDHGGIVVASPENGNRLLRIPPS